MNNTNKLHFENIPSSHYPLVKQFYKAANYYNQVGRKDQVFTLRDATQQNGIIAAARLVKTADYVILRSMVVSPEEQRKGIGKYFLEQLKPTLKEQACWCFPFEWLEDFYATAGFAVFAPEDAPTIISNKYQQYKQQGRKILIMGYP